jgi:hypothetical protein
MSEVLKIRELRGDDLFPLLAIIGKLDIKDEVLAIISRNIDSDVVDTKKTTKATQEARTLAAQKRGAESTASLILKALQGIGSVRNDINSFLADLTETDVATIKQLKLKEYVALITQLFTHPDIKDFFSSLV